MKLSAKLTRVVTRAQLVAPVAASATAAALVTVRRRKAAQVAAAITATALAPHRRRKSAPICAAVSATALAPHRRRKVAPVSAAVSAAVLTMHRNTILGITVQPSSVNATVGGGSVSLAVTATGMSPTYQWYHVGGSAVGGATSATLTFATPATADSDGYYVIVTDGSGSITSRTALLIVLDPGASFVAQLPATPSGVWLVDQYATSPRLLVPNLADATPVPTTLLTAGRCLFADTHLWGNNALTITDANQTAPDSSGDASTLVSSSGGWYLYPYRGDSAVLPAGTYTLGVNLKSLSGSSVSVKIGGYSSQLTSKTVTTSWSRFSATITSNGSSALFPIVINDSGAAVNLAICDFELFAGASDLGPLTPSTHMVLGHISGLDAPTVSGAAMDFSTAKAALIQWAASKTLTAATVIAVTRDLVSDNSGGGYRGVLTNHAEGYATWSVGPQFNGQVGFMVNGAMQSDVASGVGWDNNSYGYSAQGFAYDSAGWATWLNSNKLMAKSASPASVAVRNLDIGTANTSVYSGLGIHAILAWDRKLTDLEMAIAMQALRVRAAASSITLPTTSPERLLCCLGDSITYGQGGTFGSPGYIYQSAPNLSPLTRIANWAISGYTVASASTLWSTEVSGAPSRKSLVLAALASAPTRHVVVYMSLGANDLLTLSAATFLAAYQTLCDDIRSTGAKLVLGTILPRTDNGDGANGATFNSRRATANATLATWVGVHCDGIADHAADATMGPDAAPNNSGLYGDKIHPTPTGHGYLAPILTAAVNAL